MSENGLPALEVLSVDSVKFYEKIFSSRKHETLKTRNLSSQFFVFFPPRRDAFGINFFCPGLSGLGLDLQLQFLYLCCAPADLSGSGITK
jgi:hypothetical protein